jgi:hypothetical protein
MYCETEKCESDRGVPFLLFKRNATAEKLVLCPTCLKAFRRAHKPEMRRRELILNVHFDSTDFRSVMHEFSGRPLRRRGRL